MVRNIGKKVEAILGKKVEADTIEEDQDHKGKVRVHPRKDKEVIVVKNQSVKIRRSNFKIVDLKYYI